MRRREALPRCDGSSVIVVCFRDCCFVWDDDKAFRSGYKPFVRTALLECMREKEEAEEAEEENGEIE